MTIRVAVAGATGKMGTLARRLIEAADDLELHAALDSRSSLDELDGADVVFDVTHPAVSADIVRHAVAAGIPAVVGTSGWSADRIAEIHRLQRDRDDARAVLFVPNFSIGSVLGTAFAAMAARFFDSIEIVEAHHAGKVDSPSGTAVRTAELMADARGAEGPVAAPHADQRARGQLVAGIPVHSLRLTGLLAEQRVILGGTGETLTIAHSTLSPESYEAGILLALRTAPDATGVVVGLDALLELGVPSGR
ncbi:4-hydroxy-tetrahydrodipicolinate reductase [Agromyces aerolatus]|uniref:4-hydroxy-tetrahydrodipicolinate reductase n=1 Tax=Agromyces sp. LY-1074 TaxID=3074080 RepID=UPI0028660756|nr:MULTISPECIES: 4-hydroxy-tetrahydrodipicolinate reductase [unclassified Agromyces]MDR5701035.1 4-hydroxy-tetrahydrodipicolinate reductase [Agromyces sp. LY-1074]MDR5707675.1 4-hydroxy-tetrahydrodipicolinate reductase [Agromyces sp. LY-1358]